jgi:uncharacterized protein YbjQ (UPF0145 family)
MGVMVGTRETLAAKFEAIFPHLDERQRRLLMGAEARALGHGGIRVVALAAGVREATVSLGVGELDSGPPRWLVMAGWVPAGIVLGISATARHDELLTSDRSRWVPGNAEVAAYTDLVIKARQDARSQLEQAIRELGADGVVVSAVTVRVRGGACRAHPGGTDHFAEAVITGSAVARFSGRSRTATPPSLAVLSLHDIR